MRLFATVLQLAGIAALLIAIIGGVGSLLTLADHGATFGWIVALAINVGIFIAGAWMLRASTSVRRRSTFMP